MYILMYCICTLVTTNVQFYVQLISVVKAEGIIISFKPSSVKKLYILFYVIITNEHVELYIELYILSCS